MSPKRTLWPCHCPAYIEKYDIVQDIKKGGTFLLNCDWLPEDLEEHLPAAVKRYLAKNKIEFYTCDAIKLARDIGLGERTNMVLQSAFFKLANIIPIGDAVEYMKDAVVKTYGHKGESIVNMNCEAIDAGLNALRKIEIPEEWKTAKDKKAKVQIDTDLARSGSFRRKGHDSCQCHARRRNPGFCHERSLPMAEPCRRVRPSLSAVVLR